MNVYEKMWNERKKELAEKIAKAPNANAVSREAAELAEMVAAEALMSMDHLTIKDDKIPEDVKVQLQKNGIKAVSVCIQKVPGNTKERFEELERVAKPVIEFLNKYFDPHTTVVITEGKAVVVRDEMGCSFPVRD